MDNLHEAYLDVYEATAMAKRGYDEAPIRQQIAKSTGGGAAADRASALEKKPTFGNDKVTQQRQRLARAQRGDFRNTASSNPGLHVGQHKSDDPEVKAKQAARGAQRSPLTPVERQQLNREEFNSLLKFLYFEGYADSYEEAENLIEEMSDEEFEEIFEGFKEANLEKMKRQQDRHMKNAVKQSGGSRGKSKNLAFKMSSILGAIERGEDPRADGYGGARAARGNPPEDHRAAFSKNPLNNPPRRVKEPGVKKEEFESVVEYLFVEGYADSIEHAEVMAENISEEWVNQILDRQ